MNLAAPFKDEEHAFRVYLARRSHTNIRGFDPMAMRGKYYFKRCRNCGSTKWRKQDGVWRCTGFRCGRERPWRLVGVTRGYFQENPRRHSGVASIEQLADLGLAFRCLTMWEFRVWWAYCTFGTYRRALRFSRETWPRRIQGWSLRKVQALVESARERSRPVLERKGLI